MSAIFATPVDSQRRIDEKSLRSLVEFELEAGVHGISILGVLPLCMARNGRTGGDAV